jgi:NitT/TauT family transport system permease protein
MLILLVEHQFLDNRQPFFQGKFFGWAVILFPILYSAAVSGAYFKKSLRHWLVENAPLLSAFVGLLTVWDVVTLKFALLPLPYFPSPGVVLAALITERETLLISVLYSLRLLFTGYSIGLVVGLPCGIMMGWSPRFNYWLNPVLRTIGPIPATAWIPIAMVVFPTSFTASVFLVALSCWFPITVMTWSGIANVNKSYYEVARSLGASEWYLATRVALPAAMPSVFVGLFMGFGMAFVTLIVGEMLGVKAGLGWFITWAQGWAEYGKVYAALVVMSLLFSGIITLLFRLRDKMLVWQKGLIKW